MSENKEAFRCKKCRLCGWPAGHAESTGVVTKTHYVWDFKKEEFTDEIAHQDTVSKWVSHENGYCTTCDPEAQFPCYALNAKKKTRRA